MAFVNVLAACLSTKRTLLPWNAVRTAKPGYSFRGFYYDSLQTRITSTFELSYDLVCAEVGTGKEKTDNVDLDLPVIPVVENHTCGDMIKKLYSRALNPYVFTVALSSRLLHQSNIPSV